MDSVLTPVLLLVAWSLLVLGVMALTRFPAMRRMGLGLKDARHTADLSVLPPSARQIADNYNHLMEQPTIFYALALYTQLAGHADPLNAKFAWAYLGIRVVHSLVQIIGNYVPARFAIFTLGTLVLTVWSAREVIALF
jgi:hypothetical protein